MFREFQCETGGIKSLGTAAQTASATGKLFSVWRIRTAALTSMAADTQTTARRSSKARCSSVNDSAISERWDIWQLSLATNLRHSSPKTLGRNRMRSKTTKDLKEFISKT